MKNPGKMAIVFLVIALLTLPWLGACGGDDEETPKATTPNATQKPTAEPTQKPPAKDVEIVIGEITDMTGAAANAIAPLRVVLQDMVEYFNDNGLIPGAKIKLATYDTSYDPSKDITGYEWVKARGADLIFAPLPSTPTVLKPILEKDKMVLFAMSASDDALVPPGWAFNLNVTAEAWSYTLLKWLSESYPDFPKDRPAVIGAAGWAENYGLTLSRATEAYAKAHPDQYTWAGSYFNNFSPNFDSEAQALVEAKCDFIMAPASGSSMGLFAKVYRQGGGTATFLGTDAHLSIVQLTTQVSSWSAVDGTICLTGGSWWTEDNTLVSLAKELVSQHADANDIIATGLSYVNSLDMLYGMFTAIAETVKRVGAENFSSQAVYDTLQSFTMDVDGQKMSFNATKRTGWDNVGVYEWSAAQKTIVTVGSDRIPVVYEP